MIKENESGSVTRVTSVQPRYLGIPRVFFSIFLPNSPGMCPYLHITIQVVPRKTCRNKLFRSHQCQNKISLFLLFVELLHRDPLLVEVAGQGGDVPHVGVVHKGREGDRAPMQEGQDLEGKTILFVPSAMTAST